MQDMHTLTGVQCILLPSPYYTLSFLHPLFCNSFHLSLQQDLDVDCFVNFLKLGFTGFGS